MSPDPDLDAAIDGFIAAHPVLSQQERHDFYRASSVWRDGISAQVWQRIPRAARTLIVRGIVTRHLRGDVEPAPAPRTAANVSLEGVPGAGALASNLARTRVRWAAANAWRFADEDAATCPEEYRPGYSLPDWLALEEAARWLYLRAVLVAREARRA